MAPILLIYPPYLSKYKNIPLGLAYIASYNLQNGMDVKIIDMDVHGIDFNNLEELIKKEKPEIVGTSFMTNQFGDALNIAATAKKISKNIKTVLGGNHATALPEELLETGHVDYVVIGEGEKTSNEIFKSILERTDDYDRFKINGLAFVNNNHITRTQARELIDDLDILPFPLRDNLPVEKYSERIIGTKLKGNSFSILSSRGCPAKCNFCSSHTVFTRRFRGRSAGNIFKEMQCLNEKYGAMQFNFVDDTFTIKKSRVRELCNLLLKEKNKYEWIANARVNSVDPELLILMSEAGCRNINFGVESGDDRVRAQIGKSITREQIISAHEAAKKAGIIVSSYFMVGNLGEDWKSVEKTIEFTRTLKTDYPSCTIATPYPDTGLYYACKEHGWLNTFDWDKYYTTPHLIENFKPVSNNGILSEDEILRAYYYVNRKMLFMKLKTRYGGLFFLNIVFWKNEIFKRIYELKLKGLLNLIKKIITYKK